MGPTANPSGSGRTDRIAYRGRFLDYVIRDGWEFVDRPGIGGIVVIVAVTEEGRLLLVEQYRPPVAARVIELPAGLVGDSPGSATEEIAAGARRELREETGHDASDWEVLAEGPVSPGTTSEVLTILRARSLRRVGPGGGEEGEDLRVHEVPLAGLETWLEQREREGLRIDVKIHLALRFIERDGERARPA